MVRKRNEEDLDDTRTGLAKLTSGDAGKITAGEAAEMARFPLNFVPVVGNVADPLLASYSAGEEADREQRRMQRKGVEINEHSKRGLGRKFAEWKSRWSNRGMEAAASGAGALVGAGVAGKVAQKFKPGWFTAGKNGKESMGMLTGLAVHGGGGVAGGMLANAAYNAVDPRDQDPVGLLDQIITTHEQGKQVQAPMVAAALLANTSDHDLEKISSELKRQTGTPFLDVAIAKGDPKVDAVIMKLARKYDDALRVDTMLVNDAYDPQNPYKEARTVAEQLTDDINNGVMSPQNLLYRDSRVTERDAFAYEPLSPPETPGMPPPRGGLKRSA